MLSTIKKSWILLGIVVGVITCIIFISGILYKLELATYDARLWFKSLFTINNQEKVVIVTIDNQSLQELKSWPWPRSYHAQLLEKLNRAGAHTVGFDVLFDLPSTREEDKILRNSLNKVDNIFLPCLLRTTTREGEIKVNEISYPLPKFRQAVKKLGYINLFPDQDGKVRRLHLIKESNFLPFGIKLAQNFTRSYKQFNQDSLLINFHYQDNYFKKIPYSQVLKEEYSEKTFNNKIVLIGAADDSLGDYFMTPLPGKYIPGVVIHAEIIDNYLEDSFIYPISKTYLIWFIFLISILTAFIYDNFSPFKGVIITLVGAGIISIISTGLLIYFNYYLPLVPFVLILILNFTGSNLISYFQLEGRKKQLYNTFSRYLAPEIIEEILSLPEKDYLVGQRREITVLFVDLVGFTGFAEKNDPEKAVKLLNRYFSLITEETFKLGGTLDKFLGDGAMIFFGAPTKEPAHAHKSVKLAVTLQQEVKQNSSFPLPISIGINTGTAIVGNIGSTKRSDYTAIGNTINTAARIETKARAGEILIGEETYKLVKNDFRLSSKGEIKLRGKEKINKLYQVILQGGKNNEEI